MVLLPVIFGAAEWLNAAGGLFKVRHCCDVGICYWPLWLVDEQRRLGVRGNKVYYGRLTCMAGGSEMHCLPKGQTTI